MIAPADPLDERLRRHYQAEALDGRELALLCASLESPVPGSTPARPPYARRPLLWVGGAVMAFAVVGLGWSILLKPRTPVWSADAVADEISRHHIQNLDPEFHSDSVSGLAASMMARLGFAPIDPALLRSEPLTVVGGRYCSIATVPALQVRLLDASGRPCTLYELRADAALPQGSPEEHIVGGVRVRLWREGDLLLGLAQPR